MSELNEIAIRQGTDKSTGRKGHGYTLIYEDYFKHLRYEPIVLLEIGVKHGASLRTWEEYFPNAMIYGIDVKEYCKEHETDRIKVLLGDQGDSKFLYHVVSSMVGPPNIVIDDGSHWPIHQVFGLRHLFQYLASGGMYIIEDLQSSYGTSRHRSFHLYHPDSAIEYLKGVLDDVNYPFHRQKFTPFTHYIESIHFYLNLAIVKKKKDEDVKIRMFDVVTELIVQNKIKSVAHLGIGAGRLCRAIIAPYGVRKDIAEYWAIDKWNSKEILKYIEGMQSWAFNLHILDKDLLEALYYFSPTKTFDLVILEVPPEADSLGKLISIWKPRIAKGGFLVGYGYNRRGWEALTEVVNKELPGVEEHHGYAWVYRC